jgi:hypothetical protein
MVIHVVIWSCNKPTKRLIGTPVPKTPVFIFYLFRNLYFKSFDNTILAP